MGASFVFVICALTSLACGALLLRGYQQSRVRLLLWSGVCFLWLAANNLLLIVDRQVFPNIELRFLPTLASLIGIGCLLYGLIWDDVGGK